MNNTRDSQDTLREFKQTPESLGYDLRLDLADIVLKHLDEEGLTQNRLAEKIGVKPSYLTRIIHSASNCTFDSAARILYALNVRAKLVEIDNATAIRYPDPHQMPRFQSSTNTFASSTDMSSYWVGGIQPSGTHG